MELYYRAVVLLELRSALMPVHHFVFVPVRLVNQKRKVQIQRTECKNRLRYVRYLAFGIRRFFLHFTPRRDILRIIDKITAASWKKTEITKYQYWTFLCVCVVNADYCYTADVPFFSYSTSHRILYPLLLRKDKRDVQSGLNSLSGIFWKYGPK